MYNNERLYGHKRCTYKTDTSDLELLTENILYSIQPVSFKQVTLQIGWKILYLKLQAQ